MTNLSLVKLGAIALFIVIVAAMVAMFSGNVQVAVNPGVVNADGGYGPNTVYPTAANPEPKFGNASSLSNINGCSDNNGTTKCDYGMAWTLGTSTVCAFKLPGATSTLQVAVAQVKNQQGTATFGEWGFTRFTDFATTTSLSGGAISASVQTVITASTTAYNNLNNLNPLFVLPPNGWLLFKNGTSSNSQTGHCSAELIVI